MPSSRRLAFKPPRRTGSTIQFLRTLDDVEVEMGTVPDGEVSFDERSSEPLSLDEISSDLWTSDYSALFRVELRRNRAIAIVYGIFSATGEQRQLSSYARRISGPRRVAWEHKQLTRERDQLAIALHAANMRQWSHSMIARSIAYFTLTTSWLHQVESGQRRLASRPTTLKVLRSMRDCRPRPEWDEGLHVAVYGFDQTYEWVGMAKRGRRQAVESVDSTGMPMAITHEVYVNSIKVALPSAFGTLSPADLQTIASNHGSPYTEDYNLLYEFLRPQAVSGPRPRARTGPPPSSLSHSCSVRAPSCVAGYLREFTADALASVSSVAASSNRAPTLLTLSEIAHALYARRPVDPGGPSEFNILEALMRCDTKSYADGVKILRHMGSHSSPSTVVDVAWGDGQSVILLKNVKKKWPRLYARWLIGVGGFHEHAHSMFAMNEMFWECLVCWCLVIVNITKVFKVTKDLEHNNYAHVQQAHHVITIAIVSYLLQDVVEPRPSLLLRSPELYLQQVESATGIVLVRYLQYAGFPILQWQRAAREGDGLKLKKLFAYSHHLFRSVSHKPVCAQISLIALLSFCCALPALQNVLLVTVSLSLLGRLGGNMYIDRVLEYINKVQQGTKRSAHAASFGRALDMTTLLRAMLHVRHAFQAAETGKVESDDGISPSMLIMARLLQDELVRVLGRDLSLLDPYIRTWHTGNPVRMDTGDHRTRMPWETPDRVARGRNAGKWRSRNETWIAYATRYVQEHFFPF